MNHIATMSSYGIDLQDQILQEGQQENRHMDLRHRLQHSIGTCKGTCTSAGTSGLSSRWLDQI